MLVIENISQVSRLYLLQTHVTTSKSLHSVNKVVSLIMKQIFYQTLYAPVKSHKKTVILSCEHFMDLLLRISTEACTFQENCMQCGERTEMCAHDRSASMRNYIFEKKNKFK